MEILKTKDNESSKFIFLLLIAFHIQCKAANKVTIVTICGGYGVVNAGADRDYRMLVDRMTEHWKRELIRPGTEVALIRCDFGTVSPVIFFDLNFDDLRERVAALKPDIVLFPSLSIANPGQLGVQLITSEHEQVSAADMVKEFDIELLDNYFERARKDRLRNL